ncbi:hypothetical protein BCR34DRAFT_604956 [Clohesyomyces aquaticus]|uniref:Uncharacterized protein n=1 Tax=Clohesyomyces aquaticus TaxID=1231657 RepID=A0A1Y1Z2M9_9PLEO|nr:hypothetical protein BCR34DRAFT_604956 [Clohesyomyces aquaticus]
MQHDKNRATAAEALAKQAQMQVGMLQEELEAERQKSEDHVHEKQQFEEERREHEGLIMQSGKVVDSLRGKISELRGDTNGSSDGLSFREIMLELGRYRMEV